MNRSVALASLLFAGLSLAPFGNRVTADDQPFFGYSAESSRTERQWEEKLRAIPSPENLRAYMQRLSAHPHNVGSPYDKDNAEWTVSSPGRCAARQRRGHAVLSRRSTHAWRGRHERCETAEDRRGRHHHKNSRAADFLRGRPTSARRADRPSRPGRLARGTRNHLSRWPWAGESSSESEIELGNQAGLRRDWKNSGVHFCR